MQNAKLIDGLRWCADESICCDDFSGEKCPYFDEKKDSCSVDEILHAAADALEAAEAALNKQIPQKAIGTHYANMRCPSCGKRIPSGQGSSSRRRDNWCNYCGQKIDWGEHND